MSNQHDTQQNRNSGTGVPDTPPEEEKASLSMDPLAYYMHQDNAMWRAVVWTIPIEAGVITGAFYKPGWPGLLLSVLGTSLIFALSMYAWKSHKDRDVNMPLIDRLKPLGFLLGYKTCLVRKGRFWLCYGFVVVMLTNIFILFLQVCKVRQCSESITNLFF